MQGRDADALDRLAVLGGGVADVLLETPTRVPFGSSPHVAVAGDLGDHRGGGNRGAGAVALDHGAVRHGALAQRETVDQASGTVVWAQSFQGIRESFDVGHVQATGVDAAGAADDDADPRRRAQYAGKELGSLLGVHLLGVVQASERTAVAVGEGLVVDQDRGGHERPSQAAPPGLVCTGYEAGPKATIEGEEAARTGESALMRFALGRGLRGCRRGREANRWQRPCR